MPARNVDYPPFYHYTIDLANTVLLCIAALQHSQVTLRYDKQHIRPAIKAAKGRLKQGKQRTRPSKAISTIEYSVGRLTILLTTSNKHE